MKKRLQQLHAQGLAALREFLARWGQPHQPALLPAPVRQPRR